MIPFVRTGLLLVLLTALAPFPATAETPAQNLYELSLFHPNSLLGWDYGPHAPQGWKIAERTLAGTDRLTPLIGGYCFANFELKCNWSVDPHGCWKLSLPAVPYENHAPGPNLELLLREGPSCGTIVDGQRLLAAGNEIAATGLAHTCVVRRRGAQLQVLVDDVLITQCEVPADERYGLQLSLYEGAGQLSDLRVEEPIGESIFNGHDLAGWWSPRPLKGWNAEDGEIVLDRGLRDYLRTEREYGNFTFSFEYKIQRRGNSGIGIRTPRNAWPSGDGIELQLEDEPLDVGVTRSSTMGLYGNLEPLARADRGEQWNRVVIKTEGWTVSAWVNGVLVQHAHLQRLPELGHRHLRGWIGLQDHGALTRFRNLHVLEAPEGLGAPAWKPTRKEPASHLVLDRLMNSRRLAEDEGFGSNSHWAQIPADAQETVLAEMTGPGALVELTTDNPNLKFALFVDGAAEPKFEGTLAELHARVPHVASQANPLLTYVGFQNHLKLVARGGPARCRLDVVHLPAGTPALDPSGADVARGILPALSYRYQQFQSGRHREDDPWPRATSPQETIEPGQAKPLITLPGSGTIHWSKLTVAESALANDDLWLEATVDGAAEPIARAPVRYWFPALQQNGGGYHNFLQLRRSGLTSFLALPYGNGITLSLRNNGTAPSSPAQLTVSYEPGNVGPWRLRTQYLPATADDASSEQPRELFSLSGQARLVGLVCACDSPAAARAILLQQVNNNGHVVESWNGATLADWLGLYGEGDEQRTALSGIRRGLAWRFHQLAPLDVHQSFSITTAPTAPLPPRVVWYYGP
jgi:hypothetical protein